MPAPGDSITGERVGWDANPDDLIRLPEHPSRACRVVRTTPNGVVAEWRDFTTGETASAVYTYQDLWDRHATYV